MKLENFDTEKAISYFEEQVSRSQSDRMHKKPIMTASMAEKRLYDVIVAAEYFYEECKQHCYSNKEVFEKFLTAPDFQYIINCATAKDEFFDRLKFENSLKNCHKYLLAEIETKDIFL